MNKEGVVNQAYGMHIFVHLDEEWKVVAIVHIF